MKFDGHFMRNGVKMLATSHYRQHNHICYPKDIDFYEGYHCRVQNMTLNDYRNACMYYTYTGWRTGYPDERKLENNYMETQGNWEAFHRSWFRYQGAHYEV